MARRGGDIYKSERELAAAIAEALKEGEGMRTAEAKVVAYNVIDALKLALRNELKRGREVEIRGFGRFVVVPGVAGTRKKSVPLAGGGSVLKQCTFQKKPKWRPDKSVRREVDESWS